MSLEIIGWIASVVLFVTVLMQIRKQWKRGSNEAVSKWLFVGQLIASLGFLIYSAASGELVFAVTNGFLALANLAGIFIYMWNESRFEE